MCGYNKIIDKKIQLPFKVKKPILAFGSHTKNTLCFIDGNNAFLSRVHPDLSLLQDFSDFKNDADSFLRKKPKVLSCDLHPDYQSTKYAYWASEARNIVLHKIQHHHAHIASVMASNGLANQKVIGISFDGTGEGQDGLIWGAEFFICDYKNFKRAAHLKEITLIGAEQAIREPWRLSAAWLYQIYREKALGINIDFIENLGRKKWDLFKNIYKSGFNCILASSMGRLFDAVGALVFDNRKICKEAELAMQLEKEALKAKCQMSKAKNKECRGYRFKIIKEKDSYIIDPSDLFKRIISDLRSKKSNAKIAYCFHLAIAEMVKGVCVLLRKKDKVNRVVLSGGVFQNSLLLGLINDYLDRSGFKVYRHQNISCSDAGLSLGEAAIANFRS